MAIDPYLNYAADPSTGLLYLWQNAPWAVEGTLLFIFLLPIFLAGGKKAKFEEKHLTIFAAVFAAATELSFQIIGISFVHFTGWIILTFCLLVALTAWSVLIDKWCNNKKQYSIPIAVLLFTYMFTFIESAKDLSSIPTLGFWPSASAIAITRAASLWLLIISVLMGLNAHMGAWSISEKKKEYYKRKSKEAEKEKQADNKRKFLKELSAVVGGEIKDELSAIAKYVTAGEKTIDIVARATTTLQNISTKLTSGKGISTQDSKNINTARSQIETRINDLDVNSKIILEKTKKITTDFINSSAKLDFTELSEKNAELDTKLKELPARLTKSPLKKHNPTELNSITIKLDELTPVMQELDPKLQAIDKLNKDRNITLQEVNSKGLSNISQLITDVDSIQKKILSFRTSDLGLIAACVGKPAADVVPLVNNAIKSLQTLSGDLGAVENNLKDHETKLQQFAVYITALNNTLSQINQIIDKEIKPKQSKLETDYLTLLNTLDGHENALKSSGKVKTDINQLIDVLNAEKLNLNQTLIDVLAVIKRSNTALKVFKSTIKIDRLNPLVAEFGSKLANIQLDKKLAEASLLKIKDVLDDLKNTPHVGVVSPILSQIETEEAQIIDNLSNFKTNIESFVTQISAKIQAETTAGKQEVNSDEIKPIVEKMSAEADKIQKFIKDLEGFVAQLQAAKAPAKP